MILFAAIGCLVDIRPSSIESMNDEAGAAERGRAMLEAAAEAHGGLDAWNERQTVTVEMIDTWHGLVARLANPWPSASVHVRLEQRLHSFDSRATFLGEANPGLEWGIHEGRTWSVDEGEVSHEQRNNIAFILPTMHYFSEIPYRLLEAPILLDAGPETIGGVAYPRVFATWSSTKPNADFDQYIVYLDPETGRIAMTYYTVREIAGFVSGTMHYEDYTEIDGAWLPMTMYVTPKPTDEVDDNMHFMEVRSWSFDEADAAAFAAPE